MAVSCSGGCGLNEMIFFTFVYNIVFGTGLLLLPKAFWHVGYGLGTILLVILAILSWASCTFVIESLSLANADHKLKQPKEEELALTHQLTGSIESSLSQGVEHSGRIESPQSLSVKHEKPQMNGQELFAIEKKFEVAEMAKIFFGREMLVLFYLIMIIYLYGDLCIYLTVVGTTLRSVSCPVNVSKTSAIQGWCDSVGVTNVSRIYISVFFLSLGMFVFTNIKKSVAVQLGTMILRIAAVTMMVVIASVRINNGGGTGDVLLSNSQGIPHFFGVCLYAFMCQHSLPSMVAYVKNHNARFNYIILGSMMLALSLYFVTVFTAVAGFSGSELMPIYSMNFANEGDSTLSNICYYFLMLFPTFALCASFPIVGITLRENLIALTGITLPRCVTPITKRWMFPALALLPSYTIVMIIPDDVSVFANYVGTYAGSFVQYFIPGVLVISARRGLQKSISKERIRSNTHSVRIFSHWIPPLIVIIWTFIGIGIVSYYYYLIKKK